MLARPKIALVPLAALSMVVLALEVFLSRVVSYSVHVILLYAVLGIALLGFGAAGSLVAVRPDWLATERVPRVLAWAALWTAALMVVALHCFMRLTPFLQHVNALTLVVAGLLALPFVAAGTVVTVALSAAHERVSLAYAANLIGSGLGCFLPLSLLGPLDGPRLLGVFAVLAWCAAALYVRALPAPRGRALTAATFITLALTLAALALPHQVFPIKPEPPPLGQLAGQYEYAHAHGIHIDALFDRWNPTGRIQIVRFSHVPGGPEPYPAMFYAQDSTAGSSLMGWDGRDRSLVLPSASDPGSVVSRLCTETIYGQAYFRPRPRVLVIGLGGGPDLQCALYQQARSVDVVEINRDAIAAIRGPFDRWVGGIGRRDNVRFHNRDGRSFVHRHGRPGYDLIQLSGVDTKQNFASGALALSENHLYTAEAFRDYLDALSEQGVLSIIRFGEPEALRLSNTAMKALRDRGVSNPERHVAVLHTGVAYGVLVARQPFSATDEATLRAQLNPPYHRGVRIYYYSENGVPLERPPVIDYLPSALLQVSRQMVPELFRFTAAGTLDQFIAVYPFNIEPATDDRPFFFDIFRYDLAETWRTAAHLRALRDMLGSIVLLSLGFILWPVRRLRERAHGVQAALVPAFFAALGLGYILVEVWMLHAFAMYLGHQVYSLSVVLATLLLATGVGAGVGPKLSASPSRRIAIGGVGILAMLCLGALVLPSVTEATWNAGLPLRAACTIGFVAPTGFALGLPFVSGLAWLRQRYPASVPWCIGINGFSSVIATVGVIPLSMAYGYSSVLWAGVALYACATLPALFAASFADSQA
ncbi:MAG: spermidine synthase [Polyangiales bacterium]